MTTILNDVYEIEKDAVFKIKGTSQESFACDCNIPDNERTSSCPLELGLLRAHIPYITRNRNYSRVVEIQLYDAQKMLKAMQTLCRECLYNKTRSIK